jgi:hypothetical protein
MSIARAFAPVSAVASASDSVASSLSGSSWSSKRAMRSTCAHSADRRASVSAAMARARTAASMRARTASSQARNAAEPRGA